MKKYSERHFIRKKGVIFELSDSEYAARQQRIDKIRSEFGLQRAKKERLLREAEAKLKQQEV